MVAATTAEANLGYFLASFQSVYPPHNVELLLLPNAVNCEHNFSYVTFLSGLSEIRINSNRNNM
jgi:hypothetical protein